MPVATNAIAAPSQDSLSFGGRPAWSLAAPLVASLLAAPAPAAEPAAPAECYIPARPFCLAGSGAFRRPSEASLCRSATLDYARLMNLLAECDPSIAGEAIDRATDALAKLRCKERGLYPC